MFSDAQQRFIASLVSSMRKEYPYYLAYSDFRSSGYDVPQIYVLFSADPITASSPYRYVVPQGVKYSVITGNYSSYNSSNTDRISVSAYSGGNVSIPVYEWVYSNAEYSGSAIQPDVNMLYGGDYNAQIQTINFFTVCCALCVLIYGIINSFRRG